MDALSGIQLFVSNRYKKLYQHLHRELFGSQMRVDTTLDEASISCQAAFTQRLIITPTPTLYRCVASKLASKDFCNIAMGFDHLAKESLLVKCGQWFAPRSWEEPVKPFPHYLELVFALEKELEKLLITSEDEAFFSLFSERALHLSDTQRRVRLLAESLATLFIDYGRYGADLFTTWEKSTHPHAKWQKELWDHFFSQTGPWHAPYQLLNVLDFGRCIAPKGMQLHLFCHTDLSLLEQTLLQALSLHRSVCIYQLSPTRMYWEDLLSPRAQLRLRERWEKQGIALEELKQATELLQEPSPLLSRLGGALHLRNEQLSARVLDRHEDYVLPQSLGNLPTYTKWCDDSIEIDNTEKSSPSLLQALQGDLLLLRKPEAEEPVEFSPQDCSIQLHAAPTPMREVEVIYNSLLELMDKRSLQSRDIALYVVDLPRYLPFLRACFEKEGSPLKLDYLELPLDTQSPYVQAFLMLLRLAIGSFSARELLNLLESPYIQARADITPSELKLLRRYIQQAPIYWGETLAAREAFLQKSACEAPLVEQSGVGTWQQGMTQLFVDLVMGTELKESSAMTFSESVLMEKWLTWFHLLQKDIEQLKSAEELTLAQWAERFHLLATRYLAPLNEEEPAALFERVDVLNTLSSTQNASDVFSFASLLPRLEWLIHQPKHMHAKTEESIASLSPLGVNKLVEARIIGLIGLEEGAFPRKRRESPLDLLRGNVESEIRPKMSDQERALLLQALLSAKETLLISYCCTSPHDGKVQGVAGPVSELIDELNKGYVIDGQRAGTFITHHHPMHAYDPRYFSGQRLSNSSKRDYKLALLSEGNKTSTSTAHVIVDATTPIQDKESHASWSLYQLQLAAQDPCSLYLKEQLNITMLDPLRHCALEEEPFEVLGKFKYSIQDRALKGCVDSVLERAKKRGELPYGLFGALTSQQVRVEVSHRQKSLQQYEVKASPSTVVLHPTCHEPFFDETTGWQLPAYVLSSDKESITLTGNLEAFSSKGLLVFGTGTLEERAVNWPHYLTFLLIRPQLEKLLNTSIEPDCLFLGKQYRFTASLSSISAIETALCDFLRYAERARKVCAPIHKDWLAPLLQKDLVRAAQMMESALEEPDLAWRYRHLLWARKQRKSKNLHAWLEEWVDSSIQAYAPLL